MINKQKQELTKYENQMVDMFLALGGEKKQINKEISFDFLNQKIQTEITII